MGEVKLILLEGKTRMKRTIANDELICKCQPDWKLGGRWELNPSK